MLRAFYKLYLLLVISLVVSATVVVPLLQYLFITRIHITNNDDLHATLYALRDRLATLPSSQWVDYLAKAHAPFSLVTADLTQRPTLQLTPTDSLALDRNYSIQPTPGVVMASLPHSDLVLRVTTPSNFVTTDTLSLLAWPTVSFVLQMGIFIWLRAHWLDLEKLRSAAERFGQGHLDARANLSARLSITPLVKCFDSMADRIQMLLSNQNDMINAISHELRTPIARFGFGLALLQTAKTDPQTQRHIDALMHDVTELDELVTELLSYGALDQQNRSPQRQPVDLSQLLDSVVGNLTLEMEALNVHCSVHVSTQSEPILIDPKWTARALLNLVRNATRYSRGEVTVTANTKHGILLIHVDDDGIGIPTADREAIFEPFHRLDRSRDRNTGGFGLGLAIVMRAIQSQGGHVRVTDSPIGGARFEIVLPLISSSDHRKIVHRV